jgi:hypothetical protein
MRVLASNQPNVYLLFHASNLLHVETNTAEVIANLIHSPIPFRVQVLDKGAVLEPYLGGVA